MGFRLFERGLFLLAFSVASLDSSAVLEYPVPSSQLLAELTFWNIGQGDFITYVNDEVCWVFDSGGSWNIPLSTLLHLRAQCRHHPARLFVSHFDKDHIRNFSRLARFIQISDAYFSHLDPSSQFGRNLLKNLNFQQARIHEIRAGFSLRSRKQTLECFWPTAGGLGKSENDKSLVLLLKTNLVSILFTGDLPSKDEKKLRLPPVQILKVGHHGSRYSSSTGFLEMLHPQICVVSVATRNSYGHPNPEALQRMNLSHCAILRTDKLGNITFRL